MIFPRLAASQRDAIYARRVATPLNLGVLTKVMALINSRTIRLIGCIACVLLAASMGMAQEKLAPKPPAFFPMGLWYEGGVGAVRDYVLPEDPAEAAKVYDQNFADIAAHGINLIVVPNSPPAHHKILLNAAHKHGLKVILELGLAGGPIGQMIRGQQPIHNAAITKEFQTVLDPIKDNPALLRVQLLDEPPAGSFQRYGKIAAQLRQFSPTTPPFCCLTGGSNGGAFLVASHANVVAFDMYPISIHTKPGDQQPLRAFASVASQFVDWAQSHNADSWAVIQCHAITGGLRFPTPAELRCMTYTALGTGNRGVFWFLYQSESVGKNAMMDGLVDQHFKARPLWDEVGKLTREIKPLIPTLEKLTPDHKTKITCSEPTAYALRDSSSGLYVMGVNFDTLKPHTIQFSVASTEDAAHVIRLPDGRDCGAAVNNGSITWRQEMAPGQGMLFQVK